MRSALLSCSAVALLLVATSSGCRAVGRNSCGPACGGDAGGCELGGCAEAGCELGDCGDSAAGGRGLLAAIGGHFRGNRHGNRVPQMGGPPSPTVTYPYYTVRGPRDFLVDDPPSIGPY